MKELNIKKFTGENMIEWLEVLKNAGIIIVIPAIRSGAGYLVKALEDDKLTKFEFKMFLSTIIRVGVISGAIYLGLPEIGFESTALGASVAGFLVDKILHSLKDSILMTSVLKDDENKEVADKKAKLDKLIKEIEVLK